MKFKLSKPSLAIASTLVLIETYIALKFQTGFIRHTLGDFLAVIMLYFSIRSFITIPSKSLAILVLCISLSLELLQYVHILGHLNLGNNKLLVLFLGNTFSWSDILAYTLGVCTAFILDMPIRIFEARESNTPIRLP